MINQGGSVSTVPPDEEGPVGFIGDDLILFFLKGEALAEHGLDMCRGDFAVLGDGADGAVQDPDIMGQCGMGKEFDQDLVAGNLREVERERAVHARQYGGHYPIAFVSYREEDDLTAKLSSERVHAGDHGPAGSTPGSPEVKDQ